MVAGGRYLSGDEPVRMFAISADAVNRSIEVAWPSGGRSFISNPEPNHVYEVIEPSGDEPGDPLVKQEADHFFEDASRLLNHVHVENVYDDTALQPLIIRRLDRSGPGVAWFDYDGDGDEDLLIGAGKGSAVAVYQNLGDGRFGKVTSASGVKVPGDVTGVSGWISGTGIRQWIAAVSNYENPQQNAQMRSYRKSIGLAVNSKSLGDTMPGPIAVADVDRDGDLDVFIGGRAVTGHYPQASVSSLLLATGRSLDQVESALSNSLGIVNGAVFSDLDADGFPELIVATEWGPVRVFKNHEGHFDEMTDGLGLAGLTGLWQGVATGDFDGDGLQDIVATNWGLNTSIRPNVLNPPRLYFNYSESSVPTCLLYTSPSPRDA